MSTRLNIERSADTWMWNVQPQPESLLQLRPAMPLPLAASDCTVKTSVLVRSPQPELCIFNVTVPLPLVLSEPVASMVVEPHPVSPMRVTAQGPDRSARTIEPVAWPTLIAPSDVKAKADKAPAATRARLIPKFMFAAPEGD